MTHTQVYYATNRSKPNIVEVDDNGHMRYVAEYYKHDEAVLGAAAPELLEALKWCKSALEDLGYTVSKNVLDAIAKAEAQK